MKLILKIIAVLLLIGYVAFAAVSFYGKPWGEVCKGLDVIIVDKNEIHLIDEKEVISMIKYEDLYPVDKKMGRINTEKIEACIKKDQLIREVECFKTNDNKIRVLINQRIPVLRVMSLFGDYYIDKEGKAMPISYKYSARLPIASGFIQKKLAETDLFRFALFLRGNPFWNAQIQQIDVQQNQEVILIPTVGEQKILLGRLTDFEAKMDNLFALYKQGLNHFGWNKYKTINLRYDRQVICTPN
jgi:hypothetical protein